MPDGTTYSFTMPSGNVELKAFFTVNNPVENTITIEHAMMLRQDLNELVKWLED